MNNVNKYDLTIPQKNIYLVEKYMGKTSINTVVGTMYTDLPVDQDAMVKAYNILLEHNNALRVNIIEDGEIPYQIINDYTPMSFDILDLSDKTEGEILKLEQDFASIPIPINSEKLFDFKGTILPGKKAGFMAKTHHIISDAWSLGIVTDAINKIYFSLIQGVSLETFEDYSYLDYVDSERQYVGSEKYIKDKNFWEEYLNSCPTPVSLSSNQVINSNDSKRYIQKLTQKETNKINKYCDENKTSQYILFLAAISTYISRVKGVNDFCLGTPVLNRSNFKEKHTVGMYISTMPVRIKTNNDLTFSELCENLSHEHLSLFRHQKYPYTNSLEYLRQHEGFKGNVYDIMYSYQNMRANKDNLDFNFETKWVHSGCQEKPLSIHITDTSNENSYTISYDYITDLFDDIDIEYLHTRIMAIIDDAIDNKDSKLINLKVMSDSEYDMIVNKFNDTYYDYPSSKTIYELFEHQASEFPNNDALIFGNEKTSYSKLNLLSNQLAVHLKEKGVKANTVVAVLAKRSIELIVSLIAIQKAGGCYLPLDPEYPNERIQYVLNNSKTKILLTNIDTTNIASHNLETILVDLNNSKIFTGDITNLRNVTSPNDLSYVIYTSGSTGNPKGVMIKHNNLVNFVYGMNKSFNITKDDIIVSVTTISFDIFGLELWMPLVFGATIVLANELEQNQSLYLNSLCIKNNVNIIQTTPSRMQLLINDSNNLDFLRDMKYVLIGGEKFPELLLSNLKKITNSKIYNVYGPTETTIWSTMKDLTNETVITIGSPIINTRAYILDKYNNILPIKIPGELALGGDGLAKGYYDNEPLTAEKFFDISLPNNNRDTIYKTGDIAMLLPTLELTVLGRLDSQIKLNGHRIELGEIESQMSKDPRIIDVVVILKDEKYLVAYFTSKENIDPSDIRGELLKTLPTYMVPSLYMNIDEFPLTPNGKINKLKLPEVTNNIIIKSEKPSTITEKILARIWERIFEINDININSDFFEIGGDSLTIIKIQTELISHNYNITSQDFYKYTTIKELAKYINSSVKRMSRHCSEAYLSPNNHPNITDISINNNTVPNDNVFVTGANGFIGAHLVYQLLNTTTSKIYCLVRSNEFASSIDRLKSVFSSYFKINLDGYIDNRIFVLDGDVSDPGFGLSENQLDSIFNDTDILLHSAAIVKHYGLIDNFYNINVNGSINAANLCKKYNKRLVHVSSISVSGNYLVKQDNKETTFDENTLYIGQHFQDNVYVNSKFEAENKLLEYMKNGLDVTIFRLGIIAGRYSDGQFQNNIGENAFYDRIHSIVSLGALSENIYDQNIELTPVDCCCEALIKLMSIPESINKTFHLYNHNLAKIKDIVNIIHNLGISINVLSNEDFQSYINNISQDDTKREQLKGIVNDFYVGSDNNLILDYDYTVNVDSKITQKYLELLNFRWPSPSKEYIHKIVKHMHDVKFI